MMNTAPVECGYEFFVFSLLTEKDMLRKLTINDILFMVIYLSINPLNGVINGVRGPELIASAA